MRFFLGLSLIIAVSLAKERVHLAGKKPSQLDFVGCPTNNDFYYSGNLSSPLWPAKYPPNDKCYYYMYAEPGKVLNFEFPYYDVETCCDYVTIYDGPSDRYPILARFGGPNMTAPVPVGSYNSTTRFALVTFTSDKQIEQSGFQMNYKSVFSASPCNRDILLMINGMSGMGSQANYVKQLNFLADSLTPGWEVNKNKVRVMINLQIDDDYAVVCKTDDLPNNQILSKTIHDLVQDVPNVMDNNNPSLESLFRYSEGAMGTLGKQMDERNGIEKVSIIIIPSNANNDQDFNESFEFAHKARSSDDSKLIVITVGTNLDVAKLATLAYDSVSALHVDSFDDLPTLNEDRRLARFSIPLLPLYLLYCFFIFLLRIVDMDMDLPMLQKLPDPEFLYFNFHHWTFFNTKKARFLLEHKSPFSPQDSIKRSERYYREIATQGLRFSWQNSRPTAARRRHS